jgi:hypothetical protein
VRQASHLGRKAYFRALALAALAAARHVPSAAHVPGHVIVQGASAQHVGNARAAGRQQEGEEKNKDMLQDPEEASKQAEVEKSEDELPPTLTTHHHSDRQHPAEEQREKIASVPLSHETTARRPAKMMVQKIREGERGTHRGGPRRRRW